MSIVPETLNQFYAQALITQIIVAFVAMILFGMMGIFGAVRIVGPAMATFKKNSENTAQLITGLTDSNKAVAEMMRGHDANVQRITLLEETTKTGDAESRAALKELTEGIGTLNTTITAIPQQLDQGFAHSLQLTAEAEGLKRNEALTGIVSEGVKSMEQHMDKTVGDTEKRLDTKIETVTQAILEKIAELQQVIETKRVDEDVKGMIENLRTSIDERFRKLEQRFADLKPSPTSPLALTPDDMSVLDIRKTPPPGTLKAVTPPFSTATIDTTGKIINSGEIAPKDGDQ